MRVWGWVFEGVGVGGRSWRGGVGRGGGVGKGRCCLAWRAVEVGGVLLDGREVAALKVVWRCVCVEVGGGRMWFGRLIEVVDKHRLFFFFSFFLLFIQTRRWRFSR